MNLRTPHAECDHEDYDADILTGRATCASCGYRWHQTAEEIRAEERLRVNYDAHMAALERAEYSWAARFWRWVLRWKNPTKDEIPF